MTAPQPGHGRVLVACDKFKGSLTASGVAQVIEAGVTQVAPGTSVDSVVVADGGDGTLAAAFTSGYDKVAVTCHGPTGQDVTTAYARRGGEAIVEMADACGLVRLPGGVRAPLHASSRGLGEVILEVLSDTTIQRLTVGIGGSASTDGGAGMLAALGARFLDAEGRELPDGGGALGALQSADLSGLAPRLREIDIVLAGDVTNPLAGAEGAAFVFGPQKGASEEDVETLDAGLRHYAGIVGAAAGRDLRDAPGAGAAGGVGWALLSVLGARQVEGVDLVLRMSRFAARVREASLCITGEGSLDVQTLSGKTVAGVAREAARAGVPVVAVCGRNQLTEEQWRSLGLEGVYALIDLEPDPQACMTHAADLLFRLAGDVARDRLGGDLRPS